MLELWKERTLLGRLLEQEEHQQRWFEGKKHKPKNADAHNLDSKSSNVEPEVEIDGFNMGSTCFTSMLDWSRHRCRKDGMASEYHVRENDSW